MAKYKELSDLKKRGDLESAKSSQETAEIEKYYATDLAEYIKKLNDSILEDVEEKTESWWSKFSSIMGKIGGIVKNVMGKVVSIVKKGFSMAWEVMQLNPSDVIDNFLKIADTIQTFFIETLPQLPALVDSVLNVIDVLVDTITQPQVIDMLAKTVEEIIIKTVDWLTKNIGKILSGLGKLIGALIKGIGKAISEIDWIELFGEILKGVWNAITEILNGVWEAVKNIGKAIADWWTDGKDFTTGQGYGKNSTGSSAGDLAIDLLVPFGFLRHFFATGTNNAPSGLALVGEQGPELIDFHGGERVYNANATRDIMSSNGGSSVNNWNVTFNNLNDTSAYTMMRQMKNWQKEMAISGVF